MIIHLPSFKEGVPTQVFQVYNPKELDLEFVDLKYSSDLNMVGVVEKGPDTVSFHGTLTSDVCHICGRCLKQVEDHLRQPFELFYEIKDKEDIETVNDLREALILDHPIRYVCKEECRGLCPTCGINLNESRCHCEKVAASQPFSSLKNMLSKKKQGEK